jgi:hypothetical protein
MKTYKNLYPKIYDFDNLYRTFRAARKGKQIAIGVSRQSSKISTTLTQATMSAP